MVWYYYGTWCSVKGEERRLSERGCFVWVVVWTHSSIKRDVEKRFLRTPKLQHKKVGPAKATDFSNITYTPATEESH
jgi:hypothetical protein